MTWKAPPVERSRKPGDLGTVTGRRMLEGRLAWHRETLLAKCAGLDPAQLARATVEPSDLTLLGLVRHMAEVERDFGLFREEVEARDAAAAGRGLVETLPSSRMVSLSQPALGLRDSSPSNREGFSLGSETLMTAKP
ncbi:DUF664 domain-containing protein [Streptomyces sp. NPDC127166]|uniref:mycothiol transferase n=1 Tax=Streptomyces sp. NPDC127166 TaxID=3345380 RepID=UPI003642F632